MTLYGKFAANALASQQTQKRRNLRLRLRLTGKAQEITKITVEQQTAHDENRQGSA